MANTSNVVTSKSSAVPSDSDQGSANLEELSSFENALMNLLEFCGLPTDNILVPVDQRQVVFRNVPNVISLINEESRRQSVYFSKFIAAVASGLFDAALNYLWDETISELRKRVAQYDLSYFFDNAVKQQDKRKKLQGVDDLEKIDDSELVYGAREVELISALGFQHLDYIRYMRNWASAAHPNHNEITGLQLIAFAETCIKEVFTLPLSDIVVEIKRLLNSIRMTSLTPADARQTAATFGQLSLDQTSKLCLGLHGIFTRSETSASARQNVRLLLPFLWERVDESTRTQIGISYKSFVANNEQDQRDFSREFLALVGGESYIPDDLRAAEVFSAAENLAIAHRSINNFHTEPTLARELQRLLGEKGNVPGFAKQRYVLSLVEVFLTNGHGYSWNAEPIYRELIGQFGPDEALIAVLAFREEHIASKLRLAKCREYYLELLALLESHGSTPAFQELLEYIRAYEGPRELMRKDGVFMKRIEMFAAILGEVD